MRLESMDALDVCAVEHNWSWHGSGYDTSGYEIYFNDTGFEFTRRNPDGEREVLFERKNVKPHEPLGIAIIEYLFKNPEYVASELIEDE